MKEVLPFLDLCKRTEQLFMNRMVIGAYKYSHGLTVWVDFQWMDWRNYFDDALAEEQQ